MGEAPHPSLLQRPWLCAAVPALVAVLSIAALVAVGQGGWPGELGLSGAGFCERFRPGVIKQPANTWSTAGFVCVGLWIALRSMRDREDARARGGRGWNRMSATNGYPVLLGSVAVLLGPGSAAMHASTTRWGGVLDRTSMFLWIAFGVAYAVTRLADLPGRLFVALYLAIALPFTWMIAVDAVPVSSDAMFGTLIATLTGLEAAIALRRPSLSGRRGWLVAAAAAFLVAFAIWLPSRTGGPWCDPDSLLQGHAAWHLLCAVSVACIYAFYRSERDAALDGR